jgi:hypothetical protein
MVVWGLCVCVPAAASVIYTTHGSPPTFSTDPLNAWQIVQGGPPSSSEMAVAESFTPVSPFDLGEIDLPVEYVSGTNAVTVEIESGAARPTAVLEDFTTAAATSAILLKIPSVAHPHLSNGTKYWIVVTTTGNSWVEWFVDPGNPRGVSVQDQGSSTWISSGGSSRGSVQALSATPEASSAALFAIGAVLLIAGSRRCF